MTPDDLHEQRIQEAIDRYTRADNTVDRARYWQEFLELHRGRSEAQVKRMESAFMDKKIPA
jgi:hypothetical protein